MIKAAIRNVRAEHGQCMSYPTKMVPVYYMRGTYPARNTIGDPGVDGAPYEGSSGWLEGGAGPRALGFNRPLPVMLKSRITDPRRQEQTERLPFLPWARSMSSQSQHRADIRQSAAHEAQLVE